MLTDQQLAIAVAGVCVLAVAILVIGRRRRTSGPRHPVSVTEPGWMVLARTHDGTQYQGALIEVDDATRDQYLVLAGPIVFRRAGGEPETMPPAWDRLSLPRADVAEVWTRSTPVVDPAASGARDIVADGPPPDDATEAVRRAVREAGDASGGSTDETAGDSSRSSRRHSRRRGASKVSTP
jgi:hypothetical protein